VSSPAAVLSNSMDTNHSARGLLLPARLTLFAVVTVGCSAARGLLHGRAVSVLALAAIAIAMWHGAYDHVHAEQVLARRVGRHWLPWFLCGYVALAGTTLLGWRLFPFASLLFFLGYSAWHFGTEPEQAAPRLATALPALALGAVPIVAACHWRPAAVTPVFMQMAQGSADAHGLAKALGAGCWPVLAIALGGIVSGLLGRSFLQRGELLAVTMLQIALFALCDPLVAFAVYFCCWHTPEHLVTTSLPQTGGSTLGVSILHNLRSGLVPWILSLIFLGAAFGLGRHEAASYQSEIFIVLSALTVPHMALNELSRWMPRASYPWQGRIPDRSIA
jgi:Brp/Blh family beta-carotene 15,15'-monooxygenase